MSAGMVPSQHTSWIHAVLGPASHPMVKARKVRDRKKNTPMRARLLLNVARNIRTVKIVHPRRKTPTPAAASVPSKSTRFLVPPAKHGKRRRPRDVQKPP